jgi:thiamine monophosphate synthase
MTSLPLVAVGGIGADNVGKVAATGCRCVSVCSAVISAAEVTEAARKIRRRLESAGPTVT